MRIQSSELLLAYFYWDSHCTDIFITNGSEKVVGGLVGLILTLVRRDSIFDLANVFSLMTTQQSGELPFSSA